MSLVYDKLVDYLHLYFFDTIIQKQTFFQVFVLKADYL